MNERLQRAEGILGQCADWNKRTGGTLPAKLDCFEAAAICDELAALRAWKESALAVEREWDCQQIAKLLGVPLGQSCRKGIAERVPKLMEVAEKLHDELSSANCRQTRETAEALAAFEKLKGAP